MDKKRIAVNHASTNQSQLASVQRDILRLLSKLFVAFFLTFVFGKNSPKEVEQVELDFTVFHDDAEVSGGLQTRSQKSAKNRIRVFNCLGDQGAHKYNVIKSLLEDCPKKETTCEPVSGSGSDFKKRS